MFVSKVTGDLQQEARQLLANWGTEGIDPEERPEPLNFAEAKQAGKDSLDDMQTANLVLQTVPQRLKSEQDATIKADLQKTLEDAQQKSKTALADAKRYFRLALKFADGETDVRDVNVVRYFLCYLYYSTGDYMDAALIGEFVARRYPGSPSARQCAKIAMASYVKLYTESQEADKQFETDRVVGIAGGLSDHSQ